MASVISAPSGQARPAASARLRLSWTVLRAAPSIRPIARALTPSWASRSICRSWRMVSSLLAGIPSSSWLSRTGMPRLLTRGNDVAEIGYWVAGFISEPWPASNRNHGRHQIGTGGRLASESAPAAAGSPDDLLPIRPSLIVHDARLGEAGEHLLVQAFVAEA